MRLYQPVLFVGLGGTGCDVGAELERRMREEICGADGYDFRRLSGKGGMLAYQLPSCVQFVYADMNRAELDRLPGRSLAPGLGAEHLPAVVRTAHYVTGLVPGEPGYPQLAMRLRLEEEQIVDGWLPPWSDDEPKVNPLSRGAGQFPTIGRAALFGSFRDGGIVAATRAIHDAAGKLANSGDDLHALGGRPPRAVDVFVAFSVAGGTGCGIFYDYLHLIEHTLRTDNSLAVRIYPLVLMPSAFPMGLGGGRPAELNGGRAMLDLFRLVDQQNGADAEHVLRGPRDRRSRDLEEASVTYPGDQRLVMAPGTMQTGFLFSLPAGATREDMHRSIVSLVMSLAGTEMSEDDKKDGLQHQSFADSFVNYASNRGALASNGIGNRSVSTALVASMTVPVDEIAGIIGSRLLAKAMDRFAAANAELDSTRSDIGEFILKAAAHPVLDRPGVDHSDAGPASGARAVTAALNNRRESMRIGVDALRTKLAREVPQLVDRFNPGSAARDMLGKMDVFRLQRVVFGHPDLRDEVEQGGAAGLLQRRAGAPPAPHGMGPVPPVTPELRDRLTKKVQWSDDVVVGARNEQDAWYRWQTNVAWANAWATHKTRWKRPLDELERQLGPLTRALAQFARQDEEDFIRRSAALYRERVGASYLLPAGSGQMKQFYDQVREVIKNRKSTEGVLKENPDETDIVNMLIGPGTWQEVFALSVRESPEHAVSFLREKVEVAVQRFLRDTLNGEQPVLPRLHDLLLEASGHARGAGAGPGIQQGYLDEFTGKLAGLLPANFIPQGSGEMKVLINYPADAQSDFIEQYLRSAIDLPEGAGITQDFRHTATESISVVLFRTSMGVTEVDEVRRLLLRWAGALARHEPTDLLRWRQRTGYDFGYLALREDHRVRILHYLLNALWNGRATVVDGGSIDSPERINVELAGRVIMTLPLTPLHRASSWGSLLGSYELWALDDNDIHRRFCEQLMRELPRGLESTPVPPGELYMRLRKIAEEQITALDDLIQRQGLDHRSRAAQMRGFWADTLPAALDFKFVSAGQPIARTLRELQEVMETGTGS